MANSNLHGTAVILGDRGVLVTGRSGAGKTALALDMIENAERRGRSGRLVADDQVLVREANGRLVADAPETIRGLVEISGVGPIPTVSDESAVIDLIVRLVPVEVAPRLQDIGTETIVGVAVATIDVAEGNSAAAVRIIRTLLAA